MMTKIACIAELWHRLRQGNVVDPSRIAVPVCEMCLHDVLHELAERRVERDVSQSGIYGVMLHGVQVLPKLEKGTCFYCGVV